MPADRIDVMGESVRRVLAEFAAVSRECGAPFLLVGGAARELAAAAGLLDEREALMMRSTSDLDFSVMFDSMDALDRFLGVLHAGFKPRRAGDKIHFLHAATGITVDMVPFGPIAPDGRLPVPGGDRDLVVLGFREALDHAVHYDAAPGLRLPVPSSPGFALLKLIAFDDRKEPRDLQDVAQVMRHYDSRRNTERYFDELAEEFDAGLLYENAQYVLLGKDMGRMVLPPTYERVVAIVDGLSRPDNLALAHVVSRGLDSDRLGATEGVAREFTHLLTGIHRGFAPGQAADGPAGLPPRQG